MLVGGIAAAAQEAADSTLDYRSVMIRDLLQRAGELRRDYRFAEALDLCEDALALANQPAWREAVDEEMLLCRNGDQMTDFCSRPRTVARKRFLLEDFYLYYPLEDGAWRPLPGALDTLGGFPGAVYFPDGTQKLYFASHDAEGISNLYITENQGNVWSAPQLLGEQLTSSDDEVFPMLSPDGRSLYFSSKGLHGMGGYDIFVSRWNDESREWGEPVNLGFPYSSPYNDYLFVNTADGRYSLFASDRDCPEGMVDIYVVEYESTPVRQRLQDPAALRHLLDLPDGPGTREMDPKLQPYIDKYLEISALKDSLAAFNAALDEARVRLETAGGVSRQILAKEILRKEQQLPEREAAIANATARLQEIEMDLILSGVDFDPGKVQRMTAASPQGNFTFTRHSLGADPQITLLKPKPAFDYSFMVLPEGRFALDQTLPDGLVYQIQLFSGSSRAGIPQLRGLSPVYERNQNGRYVYSVGVFRSYNDVLSQLNRVKKAGFKKAFIIAWMDGAPLSVSAARKAEASVVQDFVVRIEPADGKTLGEGVLTAVRAVTQADLVRTSRDGAVSFLLGPFSSRSEAESIASTLHAATGLRMQVEAAE